MNRVEQVEAKIIHAIDALPGLPHPLGSRRSKAMRLPMYWWTRGMVCPFVRESGTIIVIEWRILNEETEAKSLSAFTREQK